MTVHDTPDEDQMKVAVYVRVSTDGQDPEVQLAPLRAHLTARGWHLVEEFVDRGYSGIRERRPALDRLMRPRLALRPLRPLGQAPRDRPRDVPQPEYRLRLTPGTARYLDPDRPSDVYDHRGHGAARAGHHPRTGGGWAQARPGSGHSARPPTGSGRGPRDPRAPPRRPLPRGDRPAPPL
jgi:hypothetical protein